jgi:glucose-6-phosphate dehydrogenase assembly protein OpcA
VTLRAGGGAVDRLPFAVRALLIGDLPTNLWWAAPTPPPLAGPRLAELAEYAQQIVYDSIGWPDPVRGVAATAAWLEGVECFDGTGRWRVASDLNWRRLKYWRRMLTQALDPGSAPGAAGAVTEVVAEHGPHAVVQAWELVSWLSQRLGWKFKGGKRQDGSQLAWRFRAADGEVVARVLRLPEGPAELRRFRLATKVGGEPCVINLQHDGPRRLALTLEGRDTAARTLTLPQHRAAELIGRQLSDRERDPVFRESMAVAAQMAQSVLG